MGHVAQEVTRGASMMLTLRGFLLLYGFSLINKKIFWIKSNKLQKIENIADRFLSTLFDIMLISSNMCVVSEIY